MVEEHNGPVVPSGSVALVTGAARRLGRAVAIRLARGGCRVAVHYRESRAEALETVSAVRAEGGEARAFRADLARPSAPARLVTAVEKGLGPVEVLVSNASVFRRTPLFESTLADFDEHLAVNLRAPWLLARAVAPGMTERGRGKIVHLGDIHAERPLADHGPYVASKAGLHALTLALARDLAPAIQVNAVAPGAILLPAGAPASRRRALERGIPAGRLGTPAEVAGAVAFFVEGPDFVTGEILRVDGGRHCRG
jgi:pteridine reductase